MFDSRNTRNLQYIARSNRSHPPTSPKTGPATKTKHQWLNPCHTWSVQYNKRSSRSHPPTSPILRLPRHCKFKVQDLNICHLLPPQKNRFDHPHLAPARSGSLLVLATVRILSSDHGSDHGHIVFGGSHWQIFKSWTLNLQCCSRRNIW